MSSLFDDDDPDLSEVPPDEGTASPPALRIVPPAQKQALPTAGQLERGAGSLSDAKVAEYVTRDVLTGQYCWSAGLGWMEWDGTRWRRCSDVAVTEPVRTYIIGMVAKRLPEVADDAQARGALTGLLNRGRISAAVSLARGLVQVSDEAFDTHPDLLNTPTGVVDLATGALRPHDPELYLTKITSVGYVPGADHVDWNAALQSIPKECREWFQVRTGQAITGHMTPDDAMVLMQGGGENGKSTVMNALMAAAGDYHVLVSDRVLTASPDAHPTELMDFRGARLAVSEELPEGRRLSVKRVKDTVGTPRMKARYIRQDTVEWEATHSLFLSTNYLPVVEETDHGTWRRLLLLKFPYKFLKPHQSPSGPTELPGDAGLRRRVEKGKRQQQAVLAWLVEGAGRWYAADQVMPEPPDQVEQNTRAWRADSDLILGYWSERIEPDHDSHIMSADLFEDFTTWLRSRGHQQWSDKTLVARFGGHDETQRWKVERKKVRRKMGDIGLSRPPVAGSGWEARPTPQTSYQAWVGLRFTGS